jgi:hypothetical protein
VTPYCGVLSGAHSLPGRAPDFDNGRRHANLDVFGLQPLGVLMRSRFGASPEVEVALFSKPERALVTL